jgi:hypothetical protein
VAYAGNRPVLLGAPEGLGMTRMAVGILRARVWRYSTSELAGGVLMVGMAKDSPIVLARIAVGISRPRVGCYNASELVVGVSRMLRQDAFAVFSSDLLACNATNKQPASDLLHIFSRGKFIPASNDRITRFGNSTRSHALGAPTRPCALMTYRLEC